jgi:hypothetical protein
MSRWKCVVFAEVALLIMIAIPASALNQRSFVASNGSDVNPCSRDLPCRNFAAAVMQTLVNGEVVAIDSAGYGPFTITKGVTIVAPMGVHAGISVSTGDGVTVNAGTDVVILRNLYINSVGPSAVNGITLTSASDLHVESCVVSGFSNNDIRIHPAVDSAVTITDTTVRKSYVGIFADSSSALTVTIDHCHIERATLGVLAQAGAIAVLNTGFHMCSGAAFRSLPGIAAVNFVIDRSSITNDAGSVGLALSGTGLVRDVVISGGIEGLSIFPGSNISLEHCAVSNASVTGMGVSGGLPNTRVVVSNSLFEDSPGTGISVLSGALVTISHSTIARNGVGIDNAGSTVKTTGDNTNVDNTVPSNGTITHLTSM